MLYPPTLRMSLGKRRSISKASRLPISFNFLDKFEISGS